MAKGRIVLAGYYGFDNLGDEALLHVVLNWLKQYPQIEPVVLSANPAQTRQQHRVHALNRTRLVSVMCVLWRAKALVFGGGGLLQDVTSRRSLWYYVGLMRLANLLNVPVMLLGQGLGPLSAKGAQWVAEALKRVDYIGVRDAQSLERLQRLGVLNAYQGPDLVLSSPKPSSSAAETTVPLLGLALVAPPPAHYEAVLERLARAVETAQTQFGLTPIFLTSHPQDLKFGIDLNKRVPSITVLPITPDAPERHMALFAGFKVIWGSRLHALIFAALAGVPFVALGSDPKVEQFVLQVNRQVDFPLPYWPLNDFDDQTLIDATGTLLQGFNNLERVLKRATGVLRAAAIAALADAAHHLERLLGLHELEADAKLEETIP